MKKKTAAVSLVFVLSMGTVLTGCGKSGTAVVEDGEIVSASGDFSSPEDMDPELKDQILSMTGEDVGSMGMANPWTQSDKDGVADATGFEMTAPEDAADISYTYMADGKIAQLSYREGNTDWTYRMQSADALTDISGMYYEWTYEEKGTVCGMDAEYLGYSEATEDTEYLDDIFGAQVVNWYDPGAGVTYSISASGTDLNGMDIQVYAEEMYKNTTVR